MRNEKKRLVALFGEMNDRQRASLMDYARFLSTQSSEVDVEMGLGRKVEQPLGTPRPENENVVNAIKRLRSSYFMLDTDVLFNETSSLMGQFMLHGRDAEGVIDDLEVLFNTHYQKYLNHD